MRIQHRVSSLPPWSIGWLEQCEGAAVSSERGTARNRTPISSGRESFRNWRRWTLYTIRSYSFLAVGNVFFQVDLCDTCRHQIQNVILGFHHRTSTNTVPSLVYWYERTLHDVFFDVKAGQMRSIRPRDDWLKLAKTARQSTWYQVGFDSHLGTRVLRMKPVHDWNLRPATLN